jgi:hypothetical protein
LNVKVSLLICSGRIRSVAWRVDNKSRLIHHSVQDHVGLPRSHELTIDSGENLERVDEYFRWMGAYGPLPIDAITLP